MRVSAGGAIRQEALRTARQAMMEVAEELEEEEEAAAAAAAAGGGVAPAPAIDRRAAFNASEAALLQRGWGGGCPMMKRNTNKTPADQTHQSRSHKIILTHSLGFGSFVTRVTSGGLPRLLLLEKEVDCPLVGQDCEEGGKDGRQD